MSRKADFSLFSTFQHAYLEMDFFPFLFSTLPLPPQPGAGGALLTPGHCSLLFSAYKADLPSYTSQQHSKETKKAQLTQLHREHNEAPLADHGVAPVVLCCLSSQARVGLIAFTSSPART